MRTLEKIKDHLPGVMVGAGIALLMAVTFQASPVATTTGSTVADECQAALGYPARSPSDLTWLQSCVSALTPPTTPPTTTPPATTPPVTTPPPTTVPPTTPPVTTPPATTTSPPPGAVTHGSQINTSNTGPAAWVGPAGERCTNPVVYTSRRNVTDFPVNSLGGRAITCVWFQGGLTANAAATLTAVRITGSAGAVGGSCGGGVYVLCTYGSGRIAANWSTFDGAGFTCEISAAGHVDLLRSQVVGCSDGVRFDGTNIVETWIRTRSLSSADHSDGVQAYLASAGGNILRSNIDVRPVNGGGGVTAAIFLADNSQGTAVIRDNRLYGGGYVLRLHEAMSYRVTGNIMSDWQYGPVSTTAHGPILESSGNVPVNP